MCKILLTDSCKQTFTLLSARKPMQNNVCVLFKSSFKVFFFFFLHQNVERLRYFYRSEPSRPLLFLLLKIPECADDSELSHCRFSSKHLKKKKYIKRTEVTPAVCVCVCVCSGSERRPGLGPPQAQPDHHGGEQRQGGRRRRPAA